LFVSRLVPHKGHKHVIATAGYLKRLGIESEVVFAGREDKLMSQYSNELLGLADRLSVDLDLLGEISSTELKEVYRGATVFLCLSEHEGFGMPVFEAMRSGLPTLTWTSTALAELMAGHPLCCSRLDAKRFAAAIATLREPDIADYTMRWQ